MDKSIRRRSPPKKLPKLSVRNRSRSLNTKNPRRHHIKPGTAAHPGCPHDQLTSADSEGLFCVRFSGDTDVAGPVQSAGILTPLVPLLGTAKRKEREWTGVPQPFSS